MARPQRLFSCDYHWDSCEYERQPGKEVMFGMEKKKPVLKLVPPPGAHSARIVADANANLRSTTHPGYLQETRPRRRSKRGAAVRQAPPSARRYQLTAFTASTPQSPAPASRNAAQEWSEYSFPPHFRSQYRRARGCGRSTDGRRHRLYGWDGARRGAVPSRHASGKMHERDGDGRPSTAVDGFPALTERFWGEIISNLTKLMPSAKVENAFTTRNTHVHGIKSFSTKVETSSESEAQRGELISPPPPRQSTIDGRLSAAPSRKGSKTRRARMDWEFPGHPAGDGWHGRLQTQCTLPAGYVVNEPTTNQRGDSQSCAGRWYNLSATAVPEAREANSSTASMNGEVGIRRQTSVDRRLDDGEKKEKAGRFDPRIFFLPRRVSDIRHHLEHSAASYHSVAP
ncbi:hypothetical protein B0H16DRAFT_1811095 [Mycena metata]|uniref:Uncharacterized protein n=1 Tax=Mycena metata TaxID=1033252 RepID=A0AAD7NHJ4_9AGAR|nr:hypothetical protein B0H16DRAFT_1811095 [Mycena metata]